MPYVLMNVFTNALCMHLNTDIHLRYELCHSPPNLTNFPTSHNEHVKKWLKPEKIHVLQNNTFSLYSYNSKIMIQKVVYTESIFLPNGTPRKHLRSLCNIIQSSWKSNQMKILKLLWSSVQLLVKTDILINELQVSWSHFETFNHWGVKNF